MRWGDTQVERSGATCPATACSRHSGICSRFIFLLGAAPTLAADRHVRVDVYYGRLSPRRKAWIDLIGCLVLMLPFCIFAFATSLSFVGSSWAVWEVSPDPGGLPRWPIKTAIPVAFALLTIQGLVFALGRLEVLVGGEEES